MNFYNNIYLAIILGTGELLQNNISRFISKYVEQ